jgi:hypothetical protein
MLTLAYDRDSQRITMPHRGLAVPSANVSVAIWDDGYNEKLTWAAASKGTFSTTLSTAATAGAISLSVNSLTGLTVDEPVILTEGSRTEQVTATKFTGSTVTLKDPIAYDYTTACTAKSALVYYDADFTTETTWTKGNYYQAAFRSTAWTEVVALVFRIVDWQTVDVPITYEDVRQVLRHNSCLRDGSDSPNLDEPRELAWKMMQSRLLADGRDPDVFRDTEAIRVAGSFLASALFVMTKANGLELATMLAGDPVGSGGIYEIQYQQAGNAATWLDRNQDHKRTSDEMMTPRNYRVRRGR